MAATTLTLYHVGLIRRDERRRSSKDERRFVSYEIHAFRGSDGAEYRKGFEVPVGQAVAVPPTGTHATYNAMQHRGW